MRTHGIDQRRGPGQITAMGTIGLAERALNDVDPVRRADFLGIAGAMRAIEADSMHLVAISHGLIALSEVANAV